MKDYLKPKDEPLDSASLKALEFHVAMMEDRYAQKLKVLRDRLSHERLLAGRQPETIQKNLKWLRDQAERV